ncbi:MAG TPA: hypothetical protein VFX49_09340, partial [Chloroflexota bacterium]|nr:hypothetical protein [Chloroflexota bacterium]
MQFPRRALLVSAAAAPLARFPLAAHAETTAATIVSDWDVPGGHFYTQTAPRGAADDAGYVVSDADGLTFWRDYKALGGPTQLGFPVSGRWESEGETFQATEAALLHWDQGAARVYPVFRLFTQYGMDDWLEAQGVPPASPELAANPDLPVWTRQSWLTNPALRAAYWSAFEVDGPRRYGLPMSEPVRMGPYLAQRFERAVLQLWLDHVPGMPEPGSIVLVQVADLLRRAEMIPSSALAPQTPPAPRPDPARIVPAPAGAPPITNVAGQHIIVSLSRQWF